VSSGGANQAVERDECAADEPPTFGACCYLERICVDSVADWDCEDGGGRFLREARLTNHLTCAE